MWFQRHEEPKIINDDYEQVIAIHKIHICVKNSQTFSFPGDIYLFRLWEMGTAEKGRVHFWIQVLRRQGPKLGGEKTTTQLELNPKTN